MRWTEVIFEREPLYKEVWAEPVRTVAKKYQLSDVGLRKICKKLGVPLPPLGHWARKAAGQSPGVPRLPTNHSGETRYVRRVQVEEEADDRAQREQLLAANMSPAEWPEIVVKPTTENLHRLAVRTGRRMKPRDGLLPEFLESQGDDAFEIRTTLKQKDRALRVLDAVISAALAAGAKIEAKRKECAKLHLEIHCDIVQVRLEEEVDRTPRQPTAAEKARQTKDYWFKPDLWTYSPSGRLKLVLFETRASDPYLTVRDGKIARLEDRIDQLMPRLWNKLIKLRVDAEIRKEEAARWQKKWNREQELKALRQAALKRLEDTEELANRWRRADVLRQYANELEKCDEQSAAISEQRVDSEVAWIRNAADWLDPLTSKHWQEVDGDCEESAPDDVESPD